ncbi:uncharacterized protein CELE_Y32B12B.8 [Caenorhabditis elegans]|uniref:Uncharacterized protein n=1 Tax=Caenorhabditis elegans TaxID=6239 RepID=E3CTH4_CAEEL|nr:Uncharacterized protein CELE_Y32B12B.8 [Caenorhabditis elegans]CBX53345.1 Uncharacterized protein CELE_Y32B12B.8 [Caenorhabditis elegans]|eukprot:NP_001256710.1 Uncharacterized protein CELE_Y32B12B.8 [Caenorhabditis elegans]
MQNSDSIVSLQDKQKYHLLEMQDSESRVSLSNEQKKQVQLLLNELEGQRKRRKNMSRCRKSVIYSYKFCRCLCVYRCLWLFLIMLVCFLIFLYYNRDNIGRAWDVYTAVTKPRN